MSIYTEPKSWGPHFWFVMKCVAYNYPTTPTPEDKNNASVFFNNLKSMLPCEICRNNLKQHMGVYPLDPALATKLTLISWVNKIQAETDKTIAAQNNNPRPTIQQPPKPVQNIRKPNERIVIRNPKDSDKRNKHTKRHHTVKQTMRRFSIGHKQANDPKPKCNCKRGGGH